MMRREKKRKKSNEIFLPIRPLQAVKLKAGHGDDVSPRLLSAGRISTTDARPKRAPAVEALDHREARCLFFSVGCCFFATSTSRQLDTAEPLQTGHSLTSRYSCITPGRREGARKAERGERERLLSARPRRLFDALSQINVVRLSLPFFWFPLALALALLSSFSYSLFLFAPGERESYLLLFSIPPNMAPGARLVHRNSCSVVELAPGAKATSLTTADVRPPPRNNAFESLVALVTSTALFR